MLLSPFTWALVIFTIIAQTSNRILTKYALFKVKPMPLTIITNMVGIILLLPFVVTKIDILFSIDTEHLFLLLIAGIAWGVFGYVYNVALEKSPMSTFTVITQLQVILIALFGFFILDQHVSLYLALGIALICIASILVTYRNTKEKELTIVALLLCLATAFSGAVAIFMDSYNAHLFDTFVYVWVILFISNVPLYFFYKPAKEDFGLKKIRLYVQVGVVFVISYASAVVLYSQPDVRIAYVYPLLRLGAIISVIIGIFYFNEKANWKYKIIAIILASLGAVFIKLA